MASQALKPVTDITAEQADGLDEYRGEFTETLVYKLCLLGATDVEIADILGIKEQKFRNWSNKHPSLKAALLAGRQIADANVAERLFVRACGYEQPTEKIFVHNGEVIRVDTYEHIPPDVRAANIWLKNRQREKWRDERYIDHNVAGTIAHEHREIQAAQEFLGRALSDGPEGMADDAEVVVEERSVLPAPVRPEPE